MNMHKTSQKAIALVVPVLFVAGLWVMKGRAQDPPPQAPQGKRITAPDAWVPFTAEIRQEIPGRPPVLGRFYRSSNGSERTESGPENQPDRVVDIKNIARSTYYTKARDKDGTEYWVAQPMHLPSGGWKPMQMTEAPDRRPVPEKVDGRDVIQAVMGPQGIHLVAPSLNYYALVKTRPTTGERTTSRVISTDEPARDLFEPPTGATIRTSDKPAGIVVTHLK